MYSNFAFLQAYWPALSQIGSAAESYLYSDPNACIFKLGMFGERIVQEIFTFEKLSDPLNDNSQAARVKLLKREGLLPKNIDDILYSLRTKRNQAVHADYASLEDAKVLLTMTCNLACWFMEVYGDWGYIPEPFVMPEQKNEIDYASIIEEKEAQIERLVKQIDEVTTSASTASTAERSKRAETVSEGLTLTEAETRYLIDQQLRSVGWEADTNHLRYSEGTRPQKGRNLAIAEWPTDSATGGNSGRADYALFIGLRMVGIIEAKRAMIDIPSVIDYQCKEYASLIKQEHYVYCEGRWGKYYVPFIFATNGRKFLEQLKAKSGIWFQDLRMATNLPKPLHGWISPDGILTWLSSDVDEANAALQNAPYDLLRDPDGLNLREYQIRAIEATEHAIISGKRTALLSMATGTGKTRTILGLIYRFLKTKRFNRILFLVDRTTLGEQAQDVFKEVKIEELMTLDSIYNIKELGENTVDRETRVQVATVQSLVKRVLYGDGQNSLSVSDYDLIIIDEAHRGYILDREMSDSELTYRDQDDYISKYRAVIDYFDAVKIALTATPALHTTQIFGAPVFNYSYREAVIDGYLVDHDAPHDIHTKLRDEGIQYRTGEQLVMYDPVTGEVLNGEQLSDDIEFDIDAFNRKVITEPFNRTVLEEIAKDLNPDGEGKTLIYAVDDNHADMIVMILREIFARSGIEPDAILKITGKAAGGNEKKIAEYIKRFKNERYPNIVVTVDLLTTGIDVPEITTLVFLRRIRSRILFEQMLGRATRLCPEIGKTHFEIYDPVGVYESLRPFTGMTSVAQNPSATFEILLKGLEMMTETEHVSAQIDQIVAKLRRKSHFVSNRGAEQFADMTGGHSLKSFANTLHGRATEEGKAFALEYRNAMILLDHDYVHVPGGKIIDSHPDVLVSHTRGYGNGQRPEDYLDAFKRFVTENMNRIAALKVICTKPSELTRASLKALRLELDRHDFTEKLLNSAWKDMTNEEIAADIISFIRQQALGSSLISHEQRVKHAIARLRQNHSFSKMQLDWLRRIEGTLLDECVLDDETFETGAYKTQGGFKQIDRRFDGKLKDVIHEINLYLYDDGGAVA